MLPTHTTTSRQRFTPIEDMVIKNLAQNRQLSWDDIARQLPGRTGRQCRDRYNKYLTKFVVNKEWTEEEDKKLESLVKVFGENSWIIISKAMNGRTTRQCRERYYQIRTPFRGLYSGSSGNVCHILPARWSCPLHYRRGEYTESGCESTSIKIKSSFLLWN